MEIIDFNECELSGREYGGHSGSKKGIIYQNDNWILKFSKSTIGMERIDISYTSSPLSEFIGSHVFEMIGIPVHETLLGIYQNKVVVACRDFLKNNEVLIDFNAIRNSFSSVTEEKLEKISSSTKNLIDLDELNIVFKYNNYFIDLPDLQKRYWDMFVIDALINNNDRNRENWGIIRNQDTKKIFISSVYDNGASFYNKLSDEKIRKILDDDERFKQSVYHSRICSLVQNDKLINPLKLIESKSIPELNEAIIRIVPRININKIKEFINDIPNSYQDYAIISDLQKEFYLKSMEYIYNNILLPTYKILAK